MSHINGVKVFSTTKFRDREYLGDMVTDWIKENKGITILGREVRQSSDQEFHCLSIIIFYHDPNTD